LSFKTCGEFGLDTRWCADETAPWCKVQGTANYTGICVSEKLIVLNGEAQIVNKWNFDDIPANCFDPEH
jgi:hypothetical protein